VTKGHTRGSPERLMGGEDRLAAWRRAEREKPSTQNQGESQRLYNPEASWFQW
jgi:hypothetical protein